MLGATAACHFLTSDLPKVARDRQFFHISTYKCASRNSLVPFSTSELPKVARRGTVFSHFDLKVCFARQTRVIFTHLNFQKVVRTWCVLYILTHKCASRHSGVQFFISHLTRCLRTRRFSEPTCRPSRPTNHWKNTAISDFPNISRDCIFFLLTFSHLLSFDSSCF